jgi:Xaa-Pro aminopeptidase
MNSRLLGRVVGAALTVLWVVATATASELSVDLAARRARVMERLGPDALLILRSAPEQRYSGDVNYEYRQDNNLYYLTGITQPETTLVLMPGNHSHRAILFVKERNPLREHWTGHLLSTDEARAETDIDTVLSTNEFDSFLGAMLTRRAYGPVTSEDASQFFDALAANRAKVDLVLDPDRTPGGPLTPELAFAERLRVRFTGFEIADANKLFGELRIVKTPYERKMLMKSADISVEAQRAGMHAARPGAFEYEVKAAIEAVHRARGAVSWAYPSIVGSGPNATILHYPEGTRQMQAGDLLLVDAACNYGYMASDITRTYPVSGSFTAAQRDIYEVVLDAQEQAIHAARIGATLQEIHQKAVSVIKAGLLKLGLITDTSGDQYRLWFTHGTSHYIGMDVHDVGERNIPLAPGMAFTIEPGIYVRESALDALPSTPENRAFIQKVAPVVRRYADIGVRIEDSFLVDESGVRNLSGALPKTIADVERLKKGTK